MFCVRALRAEIQCRILAQPKGVRALSTVAERVFIGLGANLGDRAGAINDALRLISAYANVVNTSFLYQTKAYVQVRP